MNYTLKLVRIIEILKIGYHTLSTYRPDCCDGTALPEVILSGAAWPREFMPATVEKISAFLPSTYVVNLLRGLWIGEGWNQHTTEVIVLTSLLVIGVLISTKTFKWE